MRVCVHKMAPRGIGVKATILLSTLVALMIIIQTVSNTARMIETSDDLDTSTSGNHTKHHRRVHRPQIKTDSKGTKGNKDSGSLFDEVGACKESNIHNFFTNLEHSFISMLDGLDENEVDTKMFLDCSSDLFLIFSKLSSTAFSPLKKNFAKNINKIMERYKSDKKKFSTLESIIMEDVRNNFHKEDASTADSVLWITRSLLFVTELFNNFEDEDEFSHAVSKAYESTLMQYHGFFVRSIFRMIAPVLPSKSNTLAAFAVSEQDISKPSYERCLYESLDIYTAALEDVCGKVEKFFKPHGIVVMGRSAA